MLEQSDIRINNQIHKSIEEELSKLGLLFRVFSRIKSPASLKAKELRGGNKYSGVKKIQDYFGHRVVLYFPDDIKIAKKVLVKRYEYDSKSSTIDIPEKNAFNATRYNLIFKIPTEYIKESITLDNEKELIDSTLEVQIRTVLSEGWHEVEHDMRYKCQEDWDENDDLNRALNGVFATLETSEWSMLKLFEELSYRHYKKNEWSPMLRTKFRLRMDGELSNSLLDILNGDQDIGKSIFRVDRKKFIEILLSNEIELPINMDNIVYLCNHYFVHSPKIKELTPSPVLEEILKSL
jgi:ppGpp synthetase/RelA/SpoT-type nucleotidyltranferase